MKKSKLVLLPLISLMLSSCSMVTGFVSSFIEKLTGGGSGSTTEINGLTIKGGSTGEINAIVKAADKTIASVSANTGLIPGETAECKEDDGDYLYLNLSQAVNLDEGNFKVQIEWGYDENDASFDNYMALSDGVHGRINLVYPGFGNEARDFPFYVKKLTCGKAVCETQVNFNVHLVPAEHKHDDITIPQIYALNQAGTGFNIVDYNSSSPYYTPNYGQDYFYVNVPGKVIYLSPDGNWGLIGDGKYVLEIYAGSALDLDADHYPGLAVGAYVTVTGNMSIYNGNMQVGFTTKIKTLENHSNIQEPTGYTTIGGASLDGAAQYTDGLMNGLFTLTGTLETAPDTSSNKRFTWTVTSEGKSITCAYDYHVDRNSDLGIYNGYKTTFASKSVGSAITIKGTLRYNGSSFQNDGHWELVPFLADHIA